VKRNTHFLGYQSLNFELSFQNHIYSKTGNGGNAGRQTINVRTMQGKLDLKTCPGKGSQEAKNGVGGVGKRACLRPQNGFSLPK